MKKVLIFSLVIALLYFGSVLFRSYQWEHRTEKFMEEALLDVAKPWNEESFERRASWWLREKSKLPPSEIVRMARQDFGNLIEVRTKPKCTIQQGTDAYSKEKHTYAICVTRVMLDKKTVDMKIRLVQENGDWKINDFISVNPLYSEK